LKKRQSQTRCKASTESHCLEKTAGQFLSDQTEGKMKWSASWILPIFITLLVNCFISGCVSRQNDMNPSGGETADKLQSTGTGICREAGTGRMWQVTRSKLFSSPQEAEEYAESLVLEGITDWRLPTQNELFDLYYIFFWEKNGACTMKLNGEYWIDAEEEGPSPGHWETEFLCSPVHRFVTSSRKKGYVRAVRP
jgi:hypothetical protein